MQERGSGASSSCRNARQDQAAQPASMRRTQDESDDDHDERLIQVQVCYFSASEANSFPALKAIKIPASEAMCRPFLEAQTNTANFDMSTNFPRLPMCNGHERSEKKGRYSTEGP